MWFYRSLIKNRNFIWTSIWHTNLENKTRNGDWIYIFFLIDYHYIKVFRTITLNLKNGGRVEEKKCKQEKSYKKITENNNITKETKRNIFKAAVESITYGGKIHQFILICVHKKNIYNVLSNKCLCVRVYLKVRNFFKAKNTYKLSTAVLFLQILNGMSKQWNIHWEPFIYKIHYPFPCNKWNNIKSSF